MAKQKPLQFQAFAGDQFSEAFARSTVERRRQIQNRLETEMKAFFSEIYEWLDSHETPAYVLAMEYPEWEEVSPKWQANKGKRKGFYHGQKGLFLRNLQRLDAIKAYGEPKVVIRHEGKKVEVRRTKTGRRIMFSQGKFTSAEKLKMEIGWVAFPKVGRAYGKLIEPFSSRQRKILRFNEPMAERGYVHNRPVLKPMYDYYMQRVLPDAFTEDAS